MNTLLARGVGSMELDGMRARDELLGAFDVDDIAPEALLFQTGYPSVDSSKPASMFSWSYWPS